MASPVCREELTPQPPATALLPPPPPPPPWLVPLKVERALLLLLLALMNTLKVGTLVWDSGVMAVGRWS